MAIVSNRSHVAQEIARQALAEMKVSREGDPAYKDGHTQAYLSLAVVYRRLTGVPATVDELRKAAQ